jgi:hypothetical protein
MIYILRPLVIERPLQDLGRKAGRTFPVHLPACNRADLLAFSDAPAGTKTKLSWIEDFVNDLLDSPGRKRRARAAENLRSGRDVGATRSPGSDV